MVENDGENDEERAGLALVVLIFALAVAILVFVLRVAGWDGFVREDERRDYTNPRAVHRSQPTRTPTP